MGPFRNDMVTGILLCFRQMGFVMSEQPAKTARAFVCRLLCVVALGAIVAGCDRCGDWYSPFKVEVCKDTSPPRP
jgi:hypothetical protein